MDMPLCRTGLGSGQDVLSCRICVYVYVYNACERVGLSNLKKKSTYVSRNFNNNFTRFVCNPIRGSFKTDNLPFEFISEINEFIVSTLNRTYEYTALRLEMNE